MWFTTKFQVVSGKKKQLSVVKKKRKKKREKCNESEFPLENSLSSEI